MSALNPLIQRKESEITASEVFNSGYLNREDTYVFLSGSAYQVLLMQPAEMTIRTYENAGTENPILVEKPFMVYEAHVMDTATMTLTLERLRPDQMLVVEVE